MAAPEEVELPKLAEVDWLRSVLSQNSCLLTLAQGSTGPTHQNLMVMLRVRQEKETA